MAGLFKSFWAVCNCDAHDDRRNSSYEEENLEEIQELARSPDGKRGLLEKAQRMTASSIQLVLQMPFREDYNKDYTDALIAERRKKYTNGKEGVLSDYVLRYLESCHSDTASAKAAVDRYIAFRREHISDCGGKGDTISPQLVEKEMSRNKMTLCTVSGKGGRPVTAVTLVVRRHMKKTDFTSLSEKVCHLLYFLEDVVERIEKYGGDFYLIFDLHSLGVKNADVAFIQKIAALQHVYRDVIKKVYCANAGAFFRSIWGISKPWFSPRIIEKITICKGQELRSQIPISCSDEELPDLMRAIWDQDLAHSLERVQQSLNAALRKK